MDRMKSIALFSILAILLAATAISGCASNTTKATPTPVATATPAPTAVPTATPAATATPTPEPTAVPTAVPSASYSEVPTAYPTMTPWSPENFSAIPGVEQAVEFVISLPWIDQKFLAPESVVLMVTGNVENTLNLSKTDLSGYPQMTASWTNSSGTTFTGTGASLNALIDAAEPNDGASQIIFLDANGNTNLNGNKVVRIYLTDVRADSNAIVSTESDGSLRVFIPSNPAEVAQFKNVVKIQIV